MTPIYYPCFLIINQGNNGPGVITRSLKKYCVMDYVGNMINSPQCKNFRVLPIEICYPIGWGEFEKFFQSDYLNEVMEKLKNSIIAHVWNKLSNEVALDKNADVAYIKLAKEYCPKVLEASDVF